MAVIENAVAAATEKVVAASLSQAPVGAWDVMSFLDSAKRYITDIGDKVLLGLGIVGIVMGGVFLLIKLFGGQQAQQKHSWGKIIALILVGGALAAGGIKLMTIVGSGGQDTILDLGGGTAVVQSLDTGSGYGSQP